MIWYTACEGHDTEHQFQERHPFRQLDVPHRADDLDRPIERRNVRKEEPEEEADEMGTTSGCGVEARLDWARYATHLRSAAGPTGGPPLVTGMDGMSYKEAAAVAEVPVAPSCARLPGRCGVRRS